MSANQRLQNRRPLKIIISFKYCKQSPPEVPKDAFSHILHLMIGVLGSKYQITRICYGFIGSQTCASKCMSLNTHPYAFDVI